MHSTVKRYLIFHSDKGPICSVYAKSWELASGRGRRIFRSRGFDPYHVRTQQYTDK